MIFVLVDVELIAVAKVQKKMYIRKYRAIKCAKKINIIHLRKNAVDQGRINPLLSMYNSPL